MTMPSPAIRPEVVAARLRAAILSGEQAPGSTVTESAVTLRYGVSRPTAKLAIERLVAEGLLTREAHQAARIPDLDRDDIIDLFGNRALIEVAVAESLARGGSVPAAAVSAQRALLAGPANVTDHDISFHRALAAGQGSARLARMHDLLLGEVELCIGQVHAHHLLPGALIAAQHQRILDAIVAADPEAAARATRDHLDGARDALLAHYDATRGDARW